MTVKSGQSNGTVEVTPSGIPVYYQSQPKRLYRIGPKHPIDGTEDILLESAQAENTIWREVPSVSTVLDVREKPPAWWGMQIGVRGVLELVATGKLGLPSGWKETPEERVVELLKQHELTTNDYRDKGGDRGQAVHDALENWARTGHMPDPSIYPEEQEGYVRGLVAFLKSIPSAEPVACEVMVASAEHGYAGRYDLRLKINKPHDVVYHHTPVRGNKLRRLEPGEYLVDLKTSKDVTPKHARQLEGYEQASLESGYEPTEERGILHVSADGKHKFRRSWATFNDFRVVLDVWKSDQEMKARK